MRIRVTRFALLFALFGSWAARPALAQIVYRPVAVTGYTADVIANGATASVINSTTATVDRGNAAVQWCFADSSYTNPAGQRPTRALPSNGFIRSITTPGLTYQMGPSSGNNSLRIDGAAQGTLTLVTPQACSEVEILATEGNGSSATKIFTVTFTDGTTQVFNNIPVPDWYGGTITPAIVVGSRVNRGTTPLNGIENPLTAPTIYEVKLSLAVANYSKQVQSLTVSKQSTDPVLNIMGISLGSNCLATPVGGIAIATRASVCPTTPVTLDLAGATTVGGIIYQWQSSPDGTTWTNIGPASSSSPYTIAPTVTARYRARVSCAAQVQSGFSSAVTVTVQPAVATVFYATPPATATFCQAGTAPVITAAPAGGRFSSTTGLVIDATTGAINLATSTVGTYTVTYTVTAVPTASICAATATTSVTIAPPAAPFSYACPPFYKNGPSPAPTLTTAAGGTFTAPTGLVINATTGVVDLTASAIGTYTVTYTTPAGCVSTASFKVDDKLVFPNVITPNGDGQNDVLRPNLANVTNYHMQVFSRWGRKVFESRDAAQGWTAAENSGGTYLYEITYTDCTGQSQTFKSWVDVMK